MYTKHLHEIEANTLIFSKDVEPHQIGDFSLRDTHYEWPQAAGALTHEAMHARYSLHMPHAMQEFAERSENPLIVENASAVTAATVLLEESRIEAFGVRTIPQNRAFLRHSGLMVLGLDTDKEIQEAQERKTLSPFIMSLCGLSLARVDAGVLERDDVKRVRKGVRKIMPEALYKRARMVWREFQFLEMRSTSHLDRMFELGYEWTLIEKELYDAVGDESAASDDEGLQALLDMIGDLMDALDADTEDTEIAAGEEVKSAQREEKAQKRLKKNQEAKEQDNKNQETARDLFGKRRVGMEYGESKSRLDEVRAPLPEERRMAIMLSKAFDRAKYRDRIITKRSHESPPGRLKVGTAMQGKALKSVGSSIAVKPWNAKTHHHVEDPSLTLGMMGDISGSMRDTMEALASATWIMHEAATRIQGRTAVTYFGKEAFSVLKPNERQHKVNIYTAPDGGHAFDQAFRALDGGLRLLEGRGARLLVINSDGNYSAAEQKAALKWMKQCKKKGVAVIWLGIRNGDGKALCAEAGAHYLEVGDNVTDAAAAVGAACTNALNQASR